MLWEVPKIKTKVLFVELGFPGDSVVKNLPANAGDAVIELDTTEQLHFHFSLSRIGEGNGNPTSVFLPGES